MEAGQYPHRSKTWNDKNMVLLTNAEKKTKKKTWIWAMTVLRKTETKKKLTLAIRKEISWISGAHNEKRMLWRSETHMTYWRQKKQKVTYLVSLCDWMAEQKQLAMVKSQKLLEANGRK